MAPALWDGSFPFRPHCLQGAEKPSEAPSASRQDSVLSFLPWTLTFRLFSWPLMTQVVDLGIYSFRQIHAGAQCLLSTATATLMLGDNTREIRPTTRRAVNLDDAWITLKRELSVDLYVETYLDHSIAIPNFIKETVETVQNSLICRGSYLQISRISHDYHSSADMIALHVSFFLCEEPHRLPQSLPGKLPRSVRGCAVDPHPPPGIDKATLCHVEIHMKSPKSCTPWSIFLTRLWLKDLPNAQLLESSDEDETNFRGNTYVVSLRPAHSSAISSLRTCSNLNLPIGDTGDLIIQDRAPCQSSDNSLNENGSGLSERNRIRNELLGCSIRCLLSKPSRSLNTRVDNTAIEEGPRLSEIAPVLFRPGYYENVQHRAGLVPVVTKSMAMILRSPLNPRSRQKIASVESNLKARYRDCINAVNTSRGSNFRSLTRCVVWTALQRGAYKVEQPTRSIIRSSSIISSDDDICLLTEESDCDYISGEDMLSSTISSVTGGIDILSDADNGNEQDSGYYSIPREKWILDSISGLDSLSDDGREDMLAIDESELGDSLSDLVTLANSDGGEIIFGSSSLLSRTASDVVMESDVASETLFLAEQSSRQDAWGDENDEAIMDDSSSISILASSASNMHEKIYTNI